jgi:hypothetical protein
MPLVKDKPKPLKKCEREAVIHWLRFYDQWMWGMQVDSTDAAKFAKEDGLSNVTPRRLAIMAGKPEVCERWKVEDVRTSRIAMLTASQWGRLLLWVEQHKDAIKEGGCVVSACSLAGRAGVRCNSFRAMSEALHARGLPLPLRSERPKYPIRVAL